VIPVLPHARAAVVSTVLLAAVGSNAFAAPASTPVAAPPADAGPARLEAAPALPLDGRTVVIDAGHQLGNHNYPHQIAKLVPAGGFMKPCNTTGTATDGGVPEATIAWQVSQRVRARLVDLGADVVRTRTSNREDRWGPCVDDRGRWGNRIGADLKLSIHADGSYVAHAHGFHVIAPTNRKHWTRDIAHASVRLARVVRHALVARDLAVANYVAGGDGLDRRGDLATLNLADVPSVVVEMGNLRNRHDAHRLTSSSGQRVYVRGLVAAVRHYLG
jgi:N-acetylmuramoyl-L-alanine amidase